MEIIDIIALALLFIGPVAGYTWAARDPRRTRAQLVGAGTLGGEVAGLLMFTISAASALRDGLFTIAVATWWPYLVLYGLNGACVGLALLFARTLGAWLSQPP